MYAAYFLHLLLLLMQMSLRFFILFNQLSWKFKVTEAELPEGIVEHSNDIFFMNDMTYFLFSPHQKLKKLRGEKFAFFHSM